MRYNISSLTAQSRYLGFLEFTNSTATSGTLPPCQNCTVAITVPGNGFPFGSYYHSTIYVRLLSVIVIDHSYNTIIQNYYRSVQMESSPLVEISVRISPKHSLPLMLKSTFLTSWLPTGLILIHAWMVKSTMKCM